LRHAKHIAENLSRKKSRYLRTRSESKATLPRPEHPNHKLKSPNYWRRDSETEAVRRLAERRNLRLFRGELEREHV
jgi:hypothetical protein